MRKKDYILIKDSTPLRL